MVLVASRNCGSQSYLLRFTDSEPVAHKTEKPNFKTRKRVIYFYLAGAWGLYLMGWWFIG